MSIETWIIVGLFFGIALFMSIYIVNQQEITIIERFGKFQAASKPGLHFLIPIIDTIKASVSLRVQKLDVHIETKTKDNVFVNMEVSVQYFVEEKNVYNAFYKLSNPEKQINAFVFDVVRAEVPKLKIDDVFEKKDSIALAIKKELEEVISEFGYTILKALVTDIDPSANVKNAMNEINEAERLKIAAEQKGEAEKIIKIKLAEAEKQSMALKGEGVAAQRTAILEGFKKSVEEFKKSIADVSSQDIMRLALAAQYFDMLKEVGGSNKGHVIFMDSSGNKDFNDILKQGLISAEFAKDNLKKSDKKNKDPKN